MSRFTRLAWLCCVIFLCLLVVDAQRPRDWGMPQENTKIGNRVTEIHTEMKRSVNAMKTLPKQTMDAIAKKNLGVFSCWDPEFADLRDRLAAPGNVLHSHENEKLVFIKTHKTAGTVVASALFRAMAFYGYKVAVPRSCIKWSFPRQVVEEDLLSMTDNSDRLILNDSYINGKDNVDAEKQSGRKKKKRKNKSPQQLYRYDAFLNHACYCNKSAIQIFNFLGYSEQLRDPLLYPDGRLPSKPRLVTVLREPRSRFFSAVRYYFSVLVNDFVAMSFEFENRLKNLFPINMTPAYQLRADWFVVEWILSRPKEILSFAAKSLRGPGNVPKLYSWYNGQSYELGLWNCKMFSGPPEQQNIDIWLADLQARFDLVMFTEHLPESMVMLADMFDWPVELLVVPPMKLTRVTEHEREENENDEKVTETKKKSLFPGYDGLNKRSMAALDTIVVHIDHQLYNAFHGPFLERLEDLKTHDSGFQERLEHYASASEASKAKCLANDDSGSVTGTFDCGVPALPIVTAQMAQRNTDLFFMQDNPELLKTSYEAALETSASTGVKCDRSLAGLEP